MKRDSAIMDCSKGLTLARRLYCGGSMILSVRRDAGMVRLGGGAGCATRVPWDGSPFVAPEDLRSGRCTLALVHAAVLHAHQKTGLHD
jgi:hypothetical protein